MSNGNGHDLVCEAQHLLRDALMEIDEKDVRKIVSNAESQLDEAAYMLAYSEDDEVQRDE